MYLHDNKENFGVIVRSTSKRFGISETAVEKDYCVFIIIKKIAYLVMGDTVLTGKNSLVKGYGITKPVLSDIELGILGQGIKRKRLGADLVCASKRASLSLGIEAISEDGLDN